MRKFKVPNTYVIIAAIIVVCAVLTWFVPGGQYVKADDGLLHEPVIDGRQHLPGLRDGIDRLVR